MSNVSKNLTKTLGGAAAAVLSVAALARAQQTGAVPARGDSIVTQRVIILPGRMDSIAMMAAKVLHERAGNTAWIALTSQLDSLIVNGVNKQRFVMRDGMVAPPGMARRTLRVAKGWIGINTQGPSLIINDSSGTRYRFFGYQPIISVDPGSPADRAGIEPGDLLVAYNGVDLFNHEFNFNEILAPRKRVDVTVRRDGDVRNYALTVATTPEEVARRRLDMDGVFRLEFGGEGPAVAIAAGDREGERGPNGPVGVGGGNGSVNAARVARGAFPRSQGGGGFGVTLGSVAGQKLFFFSSNGLFGASLSNVNEELAKALRIRKGVLVNDVPEDSPAFRAGLRSGDVIVTADDDSVTTVNALRNVIGRRLADRSVDLQVVRQQKVRKLTVSWPGLP